MMKKIIASLFLAAACLAASAPDELYPRHHPRHYGAEWIRLPFVGSNYDGGHNQTIGDDTNDGHIHRDRCECRRDFDKLRGVLKGWKRTSPGPSSILEPATFENKIRPRIN